MATRNVLIIGSAGRDFHNFNVHFRNNPDTRVVGFTAGAQVPGIAGRRYPASLAGERYPDGIPIYAEEDLPRLISELEVDDCVFAYSDVPYRHVMGVGAIVNAAGACFTMLGPKDTMIKSRKPVIAVGAVRTGSGKSQTSRRVIEYLLGAGLRVVAVRHPMPYGDVAAQRVQRFATLDDLARHHCTVEEMEEYEPHVTRGNVIYAGVDYEEILRAAEEDPQGCDVIVWDGGNNDFPFYKPDLMITVADPHRPGHERTYYPGEINLRLADVVVINKIDTAAPEDVQQVREAIAAANPAALVVDAASPIRVDDPSVIRGKRVLVIEDGPTLTHGEMRYGAGVVAARRYGATELVDPRPFVTGSIRDTFEQWPEIGPLLPAMGYGTAQQRDLEKTIAESSAEAVVIATPIDLSRVIEIDKPTTRVYYDLQEIGRPELGGILEEFRSRHGV
jgi:predicted GTPase